MPGWALRWGITAVFFAFVLFLALGWLIKYPDVVEARVVLVTENPPVRVFARSDGKISRLQVKDKDPVEEGQVIALLENTADWEDLNRLEALIAELEPITDPARLLGVKLPEGLRLGELQIAYAAYQQAVHDFQFFEGQQGVLGRVASLEQQIGYLGGLNNSLAQQEQTLQREVSIAEKNLDRSRGLYTAGTISELDLERAETNYLQYKRQLEALQSDALGNKLQIEQFKSQIIELRQDRSAEGMQKWLLTRELLQRLKSEFGLWKQSYLITSPVAGRISLTRVWSPQQFVQANEEVATVVPEREGGPILGKASLPVGNSGKVRPGQRVNILLDGYPFREFGVLRGMVKSIALVPDGDNYFLEIALPDSLVTTYKRAIPFSQELSGTARVVTEDRRVLERVFDQLSSLARNN